MPERDPAQEERPTRRPPASTRGPRPASEPGDLAREALAAPRARFDTRTTAAAGRPLVGDASELRVSVAPSERATEPPPSEERAPIFSAGELVDGTYEIRKLLGEGGMAQVFEAHDHLLDRRVALKAAWPDPQLPPLRNEARALAAFRHPSLVTVHTLGQHRGVDFIVMERVYGISLADHISERKSAGVPFRVEEVVGPIAKLASGLAIVHRAGIAHRDVKPGNVMLTPTDRVVLMDFGLVLPEYAVSSQNFIAGSPPYMPPESLTNTVDSGGGQLVDIYALGVIAWEMLALERPYDTTDLHALVRMFTQARAPRIDTLRDDVPPRLAALIDEMMSPDPASRPQSAEAVSWQLQAVAERLAERGARTARAPAQDLAQELEEDTARLRRPTSRPGERTSTDAGRRPSDPVRASDSASPGSAPRQPATSPATGKRPSVAAERRPSVPAERRASRPPRRLSLPDVPQERLNVMVVDDDEAISRVLGFYVQQALPSGVELSFARNGEEAVAALRKAKTSPDLILLDLTCRR